MVIPAAVLLFDLVLALAARKPPPWQKLSEEEKERRLAAECRRVRRLWRG